CLYVVYYGWSGGSLVKSDEERVESYIKASECFVGEFGLVVCKTWGIVFVGYDSSVDHEDENRLQYTRFARSSEAPGAGTSLRIWGVTEQVIQESSPYITPST
ncbi:hypothetical protein HAX54_033035, partial [Datura stramonium]|nr:hypothetical protein [Datura stramonium]